MPRAYRTRDWWARRLPPLVAQGLSDPQIGRRLCCGPDAVGKWRRRLGLAHTRSHPRQAEARRGKLARQLAAGGWDSLTDTRHLPARLAALREFGAPLSRREGDALRLLRQRPRTAAEVAEALGLSCPTPAYRRLSALAALGLATASWSGGRKVWSAETAAPPEAAGDFRPRTVREPTPKRMAV